MKLYIKEHVFTWGDKFSVLNEQGEEVFFVEGEVFTWGKKLHVYNAAQQEVTYIEQELFTFRPCYHVPSCSRSSAAFTLHPRRTKGNEKDPPDRDPEPMSKRLS